jgi:hypothetical protein
MTGFPNKVDSLHCDRAVENPPFKKGMIATLCQGEDLESLLSAIAKETRTAESQGAAGQLTAKLGH